MGGNVLPFHNDDLWKVLYSAIGPRWNGILHRGLDFPCSSVNEPEENGNFHDCQHAFDVLGIRGSTFGFTFCIYLRKTTE